MGTRMAMVSAVAMAKVPTPWSTMGLLSRKEVNLQDPTRTHSGHNAVPPQPHYLPHFQPQHLHRPQSWPQQVVVTGKKFIRMTLKRIRVYLWDLTNDLMLLAIQMESGAFVLKRLLRLRLAGLMFAISPRLLSNFGCTPLAWKLGIISFSK